MDNREIKHEAPDTLTETEKDELLKALFMAEQTFVDTLTLGDVLGNAQGEALTDSYRAALSTLRARARAGNTGHPSAVAIFEILPETECNCGNPEGHDSVTARLESFGFERGELGRALTRVGEDLAPSEAPSFAEFLNALAVSFAEDEETELGEKQD